MNKKFICAMAVCTCFMLEATALSTPFARVAQAASPNAIEWSESAASTAAASKKPGRPGNVKATAQGGQSIRLSWGAVLGATHYYIYRATSKNGPYSCIKKLSGSSTSAYTDKNLKSDTTYYYKIVAYKVVNGKGIRGAASAIASAKTQKTPAGGNETIPVNISVGGKTLAAQFYNNETAKAFIGSLPLTINMAELNGNEKYYTLPAALPTSKTERPAVMQAGDIMLWHSNTLVLFYETFANSYDGYTRLGYVTDAKGLAEALGTGGVTVTFSAP